jgi:hypothetical protein
MQWLLTWSTNSWAFWTAPIILIGFQFGTADMGAFRTTEITQHKWPLVSAKTKNLRPPFYSIIASYLACFSMKKFRPWGHKHRETSQCLCRWYKSLKAPPSCSQAASLDKRIIKENFAKYEKKHTGLAQRFHIEALPWETISGYCREGIGKNASQSSMPATKNDGTN